MKKIEKFLFLIVLIATLAACKREINTEIPSADQMASISRLAKMEIKSQKDFDEFKKSYIMLNDKELDLFDELQLNNNYEKVSKEVSNPEVLKMEMDEAKVFRKKINQLSLKKYGASYNKVSDAELNILLSSVNNISLTSTSNKIQGSCPSASFNNGKPYLNFGFGGKSITSYRFVDHGAGDCEFKYSGGHNQIRTWDSYIYLAQLAERSPMRHSIISGKNYTYILFGYNRVKLLGGANYVATLTKMGVQ
jgi:hypothetical protein